MNSQKEYYIDGILAIQSTLHYQSPTPMVKIQHIDSQHELQRALIPISSVVLTPFPSRQ